MNGAPNGQVSLGGAPAIDAELLQQEIASGRHVWIVDVRALDDFRAGHLPGARSIPLPQLVARRSELEAAARSGETIVVVSRRGIRSRVAAAALGLAGFYEVATLTGGMTRWCELGFPLERST